MKIDWARKLTSRKWWLSVAEFVVGTCILFKVDATQAQQIGAYVLIVGSVFAYTIGEGMADAGGQVTAHINAGDVK